MKPFNYTFFLIAEVFEHSFISKNFALHSKEEGVIEDEGRK